MEYTEEQQNNAQVEAIDADLFEESVPAETLENSQDLSGQAVSETEHAEVLAELELLKAQLEPLKLRNDQLMRVAADFENYKRRQEREREETTKYAGQQVIINLLPVLDNFERALQSEIKSEETELFAKGIHMIHKQLLDLLGKSGATIIEAMGEKFNPEFHEAIMSEENEEVPDETVIGEFQKGYIMNGRVIRPTVVKVSKAS